MRLGIYFDLRNPPAWRRPWATAYSQALERIEEAERLGIASVWVSEHHFYEDGYLPQPFTFAAAVAARSKRIRIGTAIAVAGLRSAADLAEQAAIVDILSQGRFELGLGAGYVAREFEAFHADVTQRFPSLESRARAVRRLWDERGVMPPPVQERLPIWIGTQGPRGARIAGRLGEGLLWLGTELFQTYRTALAEAGHDPAGARVSGLANMVIADDPEAAWPRIAPHLSYQWTSYAKNSRRPGAIHGARSRQLKRQLDQVMQADDEVDPDSLRSAGPEMNPPAFDVVTPGEAVERLTRWLGPLPVDHVYFWASIAGMPDDLAERHIELLAVEVAPAVADVGAAPAPAGRGGA
jgi:alkanesulfonate monooxygenase SsuD/methylene tetrahydromethanopterin reductase-like flavin-dependent oxidoreductase (luciferase family)